MGSAVRSAIEASRPARGARIERGTSERGARNVQGGGLRQPCPSAAASAAAGQPWPSASAAAQGGVSGSPRRRRRQPKAAGSRRGRGRWLLPLLAKAVGAAADASTERLGTGRDGGG